MSELADEVLRMVHAFSDPERRQAVRDLAARIALAERRAIRRGAAAAYRSVLHEMRRCPHRYHQDDALHEWVDQQRSLAEEEETP